MLGNAYRLAGRPEDVTPLSGPITNVAGLWIGRIVMIQEQAGHLDEARKTAAKLAELRPTFTVASYLKTQFRRDTDQLAADVASLRATGVREQ